MKKLLAAIFAALCGAVSLFADDVADVKAVIIRDCELAARGDCLAAAARWTPDYQEVSPEGVMNYAQAKRALVAMDGKHPVEFLTTLVMIRSGKEPNADMAEGIRLLAQDREFLENYPVAAKRMAAVLKASAALELKTLKFVSVEAAGGNATAVLTYRHVTGGQRQETVTLRKIDGEWRIARRTVKNL